METLIDKNELGKAGFSNISEREAFYQYFEAKYFHEQVVVFVIKENDETYSIAMNGCKIGKIKYMEELNNFLKSIFV